MPGTVAGLIVARLTAGTLATFTATAGGGGSAVVTGFAANTARIRAVVAIIRAVDAIIRAVVVISRAVVAVSRAVVAIISARRRLGAGIGDGYRAAGSGHHQRDSDRKRRQTHIRPNHSASPTRLRQDAKDSWRPLLRGQLSRLSLW